jgi:hypothetical protein
VTPTSGYNRYSGRSLVRNSKTERIQKWNSKSKNPNLGHDFIKLSKSSKNLPISSEISNSIRKITNDIKSKIDTLNYPKSKKNPEFFKKKYINHKRGIQSDFGINSRKYLPGNMKHSSVSHHHQHFEINSKTNSRQYGKLDKMNDDLKMNRKKFKKKWNDSRLQKKKKRQKWEKEEFNRIQSLNEDAKDSFDEIYPPDQVSDDERLIKKMYKDPLVVQSLQRETKSAMNNGYPISYTNQND